MFLCHLLLLVLFFRPRSARWPQASGAMALAWIGEGLPMCPCTHAT